MINGDCKNILFNSDYAISIVLTQGRKSLKYWKNLSLNNIMEVFVAK